MLKNKDFGKIIPLVGVISGICNIVSVWGGYFFESLEKLVMPGSFLVLFWFMGIGVKFIKKSETLDGISK